MPSSVDCVIETTPGWTTCSSPIRVIRRSTSSVVSFPSGVGTVSSLMPAIASGAPPSSTLRCALSAQTTPCHGRSIARSPTTFAAVPLKTGKPTAPAPKCSRTRSASRAVTGSAP